MQLTSQLEQVVFEMENNLKIVLEMITIEGGNKP